MGLLDSLKELISKEETPPAAPPVVPPAVPAVDPVVPTVVPAAVPPAPAGSPVEPTPVVPPVVPVPVATAAETIIPPAGVVDPTKTTGGTVFDRLDRGEKVSPKEINEAFDDPNGDLKARLMKSGR